MQYKPVKARRQGTSLTLTVPASFKVSENALFEPTLLEDGTISYIPIVSQADREHDRQLIEEAFNDDILLTPAEMEQRFAKFGWGKNGN